MKVLVGEFRLIRVRRDEHSFEMGDADRRLMLCARFRRETRSEQLVEKEVGDTVGFGQLMESSKRFVHRGGT